MMTWPMGESAMSTGKENNMRQVRWASWMVGMAVALAVGGARPAAADVRSDQAAAIVEWPSVLFFGPSDNFLGFGVAGVTLDTVIQLTNTSPNAVFAHCFYENANSHCVGGSNAGTVCSVAGECCGTLGCGVCTPQWNETDFTIQLTPFQPLGWLASQGMAGFDTLPMFTLPLPIGKFPLSGTPPSIGPDGSSNATSRIPPVPEEPFNGSLRCIAVDENHVPVDSNVLKGEASIELFIPGDSTPANGFFDDDVLSVAKHNAIGIQAIPGAVNDDNILTLGGPTPEYNGCPNFLILNAFFDGAVDPVADDGSTIFTALTLVPCTQDFLRQIPGATGVQYLVFNEFEQRLSTSQPNVKCKELTLLSNIETPQNERSIFFVGNEGTLSGQVRINPLDVGLLGVATEIHIPGTSGAPVIPLADFNLHYQGDRDTADIITLP
jgi:hypothetical protein